MVEAENNYGVVPYWMYNDLMALETERDWESIRNLCGLEDGRKEME